MKKYLLPFPFFFISLFVILAVIGESASNSFSQSVAADTNHIMILMDSCKTHGDMQCGNDLLKLIQEKLTVVQNGKEKLFYQKAEIQTLRNIGNVYSDLSDLSKAMEYYQMSMKKTEEIGDKLGLAAALLNIGMIYSDLSNYPKALDYQEKSLSMFQEIKDKRGIGIRLNNLGNIYQNQCNYSKALEYFQNSLTVQQERADTFEIMTCFNNIGLAYEKIPDFSKAIEYLQQGLMCAKKIKDIDGRSRSLSGIGNILYLTGKQKEAEQYYDEVLKLSKEAGNLYIQSEAYKSLRNVFEKQGRYKEALGEFDKHIKLRDSIFSQQQSQDIARRDAKYESDKKEAAMTAEQEREREIAAAESRRQKVIILSVILGLLFSVVFGVFIFRSLRITRKQKQVIETKNKETEEQKKVIEAQKKIVEEHNKDITDSINYAQRIQKALLASDGLLAPTLKGGYATDYFVLFKPKDIVSGDFYWATEV